MSEPAAPPAPLVFQLEADAPTKRPEQLASVLARTIGDEFPELVERVRVEVVDAAVEVGLGALEAPDRQRVAHRVRQAYYEFTTSPWY